MGEQRGEEEEEDREEAQMSRWTQTKVQMKNWGFGIYFQLQLAQVPCLGGKTNPTFLLKSKQIFS